MLAALDDITFPELVVGLSLLLLAFWALGPTESE